MFTSRTRDPAFPTPADARQAWSIVLASGTLSPLDSFAGELRLPFHVQLEAPHVVDMGKQVGRGPGMMGLAGKGRAPDGVLHAPLACWPSPHAAGSQLQCPVLTHAHRLRRPCMPEVWAGVLPNGPDGRLITGTYKEVDTVS